MVYRLTYLLFVVFNMITFSSCSKDNDSIDNPNSRVAIEKMVDSQSTEGLLNNLYVGCDGDIETLARLLNVTPSTIKRIRKGKTIPTERLEDRIREVSIIYIENDKKFSKLRSSIDPEYRWYETILDFPFHHPWWFWIGNICLIILLIAFRLDDDTLSGFAVMCIILVLEILIGIIAWIASLISSPNPITDSYTDSINPKVEQVK